LKPRSAEKAELIAEAAAAGIQITDKQIDRWRLEKLLQPPGKAGAGRGRGVRRPAAEGTTQQVLRLHQLLAQDRSVERAAFRLWVEGYEVPLERVRAALRKLRPDPARLVGLTSENVSNAAEHYSETLRKKTRTPKRVKKMVDDGSLPPLLATILSLGLGRETDPRSLPKFGEDFERYAGLDRARSDHWEGKQPWLTGDMESQMSIITQVMPKIRPGLVDEATEDEYERSRLAFRSLGALRRCAELLERLHGENVFGFGMLTKPPIGVSTEVLGPILLIGLLGFCQALPKLIDNMIGMGAMLETSLTNLRQQVDSSIKNVTTT
jgi:hypothetical protein